MAKSRPIDWPKFNAAVKLVGLTYFNAGALYSTSRDINGKSLVVNVGTYDEESAAKAILKMFGIRRRKLNWSAPAPENHTDGFFCVPFARFTNLPDKVNT